MSAGCQIFRNKENVIEKVVAPNNKESLLYRRALDVFGGAEQASSVWATAYIDKFKNYYGNWENPQPGDSFNLDKNGEPLFEDIISFLEKDSYKTGVLSSQDVMNVSDMMIESGVESFLGLQSVISNSFVIDGNVVVSEQNLKNSGLYTNVEIDRITSNPQVQSEVQSELERILNTRNTEDNEDLSDAYFPSEDAIENDLIFRKPNEFNSLGKQSIYNPTDIHNAIIDAVAGTSGIEFDSAFQSIPYPSVVVEFIENPSFASEMRDRYSGIQRVQELDRFGNPKSSADDIEAYAEPVQSSGRLRSLSMAAANEIASGGDASSVIRKAEKEAIRYGIDIIGLSDIYKRGNAFEIEEFLREISAYIGLARDGSVDLRPILSSLSARADRIFGRKSGVAMTLDENIRELPVVYMRTDMNDVDAYNNLGLLRVGENLYVRTSPYEKEAMYDEIVELAKRKPTVIPFEAYPSKFFSGGVLDFHKVRVTNDNASLKDGLKKYVLKRTDSYSSEEMVLARLALGLDSKPMRTEVDIEAEYVAYMSDSNMSEEERMNAAKDLWKQYLKEKIALTDAYDKIFRNLVFDPDYTVRLSSTDNRTRKSVMMNANDDIKKKLRGTTPAGELGRYMFDVILYGVQKIYGNNTDEADFYNYLYRKYPSMLDEYKRQCNVSNETGMTEAVGEYGDFIRIGDRVMMKVSDGNFGGLYMEQSEKYTDSMIKFDKSGNPTQRPGFGERTVMAEERIKITKKEKDSLSDLECS